MSTETLELTAARLDIEYYQLQEFSRSVTITDGSGNPVDLSGKALLMQVKNYKEDTTALAELTETEISVSGVDNNILTFSGTYDIDAGSFYYDLWNTDDDTPVLFGRFIVTQKTATLP